MTIIFLLLISLVSDNELLEQAIVLFLCFVSTYASQIQDFLSYCVEFG